MACFGNEDREKIEDVYLELSKKDSDLSIQEQIEMIDQLNMGLDTNVFIDTKNNLVLLNETQQSYAKMQLNAAEKTYAGFDVFKDIKSTEEQIENLETELKKAGYTGSENKFGYKSRHAELKKNRHPGAKRLTDEELVLAKMMKAYDTLDGHKSNARIVLEENPKGIMSTLVLDGEKFIAVHSEKEMRIFSMRTGFIDIIETNEKNIGSRMKEVPVVLSDILIENFNSERPLPDRIANTIRVRYAIGADGKIPLERRVFKAKQNSGLFANVDETFSSLKALSKKSQDEYATKIREIASFIPQNVREVLLGKDGENTTKQAEFYENFGDFLNVFENLEVPIEQVWGKSNWELNEKGELVQKKLSAYKAPNYLDLLGTRKYTSIGGEATSKLVLDPAVSEIVKFYSIKAMADMDKMLQDMRGKDADEISKLLGIEIDETHRMMNDFIMNNALPVSSFAKDAAKDAFAQIGLSTNSNMNINIKEGVIASMQALIEATMANSKYMNYMSATSEKQAFVAEMEAINDYKAMNKEDQKTYNKAIFDRGVEIDKKYRFSTNLAMFQMNTDQFVTGEESTKAFSVVNKLKYINLSEKRQMPSETEIEPFQDKILNKTYNINPDMNRFANQQHKAKWNYKQDFDEVYKKYQASVVLQNDSNIEKIRKNALRNLLHMELGAEKIDMSTHQIDEIKTAQSNNDKITRELETLITMYDQFKNGFYLPWAEVASGRMMIQSDMNPQESKLIRSFVEQNTEAGSDMAGHSYDMSKADFSMKNKTQRGKIEMLEMALSQALDMDPDKNSKPSTLKRIREIVDITGTQLEFGDSDLGTTLERLVTEDFTENQQGEAEMFNKVFNEGEGHHGLQAVRMLRRLHTWNKSGRKGKFNNNLTIETDAITSGMMLTLMQIADESSIDMLAKGGIFTDATLKKWSAYTQKWLAVKYDVEGIEYTSEKKIPFGPSSLIEAGNYHQKVIEEPAEMMKVAEKRQNWKVEDIMSEEVYQDLYKTIGLEMKSKVENKKQQIDDQIEMLNQSLENVRNGRVDTELKKEDWDAINPINREIVELNVQKALMDKIGNIDPKVLRLVAKDPVMVYIYGSTINSIRKLLGVTVGKKQLLDSIKTQAKLTRKGQTETLDEKEVVELTKANAFVEAVLTKYEQNNFRSFEGSTFDRRKNLPYKQVDEEGRIIGVTEENNLDHLSEADLLMHLEMNEDIMNILKDATDETFGDAIEDAFEAKAGSVDKYRNTIKSIELMIFELFRARSETMKKDIEATGPMTQKKFDAMLQILEESGYGHDIPTGEPDVASRKLPLIKYESTGAAGQGSVSMSFDKNIFELNTDGTVKTENGKSDGKPVINMKLKNKQHRIAVYLMSREFASNTGASPTISIHQQDSRAITMTIEGNAWLSIYDAVVQASDPKNVSYSNDTYNKLVFDQNTDRDILGDNLEKLRFMYDGLIERSKSNDAKESADAKREIEEIGQRLSTSEEIDFKLEDVMTDDGKYRATVHSSTILFTKEQREKHVGTVVFGNTKEERLGVKVRRLTEKYRNSNVKIIKEVHYTETLGKKSISKTVVKTIQDDIMHVTETHKINASTKEEKKHVAYKVEYEVVGKTAIAAHNDYPKYQKGKDVPAEKQFRYDDLTTEYVELDEKNGWNMLDIIAVDEFAMKQVGDKKILSKPLSVTKMQQTLSGSDFKSESKRLFLPIPAIMEYIGSGNEARRTRYDNFKNTKWHIGHAAISDTVPIGVGSYSKKIVDVNVNPILEVLKKQNTKNRKNNTKYVKQQMKMILSDEAIILDQNQKEDDRLNLKLYKKIVNAGIQYAEESGSEVYVIGGKFSQDPIGETFDNVALRSGGYYTADSVVTILPNVDGFAIKQNGKHTATYKDTIKALKAGSEIVMENDIAFQAVSDIVVNAGSAGTTDKDGIFKLIQNQKPKAKMNAGTKKAISAYQMQSHMLTNGYEIDTAKSNAERTIYKPNELGYNNTQKLKEILEKC